MIPSEIKALLGDAEITAYAKLGAGLKSAIGETHLVLVAGQIRIFSRDSIIGDFAQPALDSGSKPLLTPGTFNDTLELQLADGTEVSLNVSSFDRSNVADLLDKVAPMPANSMDDPEQDTVEPPIAEDTTPEAPLEPGEVIQPPPAPEPSEEDLDSLFATDDVITSIPPLEFGSNPELEIEPMPAFVPDPAPVATEAPRFSSAKKASAKRSEPDDKKDIKPDANGVYAYKSPDPGCTGCIVQIILFFGSVYLFWELQPAAMDNLWSRLVWGVPEHSGFLWVVAKIITVIAGGYFGVQICKLVSMYAKAKLLSGAVMFKGNTATVIGPKARTTHGFELNKPFSWSCDWYSSSEDEDAKRALNVQIRITQGSKIAVIKGMIQDVQPEFFVENMNYNKVKDIENDPDAVTFPEVMLRQVIRRMGWLQSD